MHREEQSWVVLSKNTSRPCPRRNRVRKGSGIPARAIAVVRRFVVGVLESVPADGASE